MASVAAARGVVTVMTLTSGAAASGPGTVTYAVAANAGGPRTGMLTVAEQRVELRAAVLDLETGEPHR